MGFLRGLIADRWFTSVLVAMATVGVFLPALDNEFLSWDDHQNFLQNPHYRGLGWKHLAWMFSTVHMGHYIPLTWVTFGVDYLLWGMDPRGYHLTNVLIHAAAAIVFFHLAARILRLASPGSTISAIQLSALASTLLFAIHPLRVESVAWVTERRDVLSGFFFLAAVLSYVRACEAAGSQSRRPRLVVPLVLFAFALLSKSIAVTLPVVLLILDVYPLGRLGARAGGWLRPGVWIEKVPFFVLSIVAAIVAVFAAVSTGALTPVDRLGLGSRLLVSAYAAAFYLLTLLVPRRLAHFYELPVDLSPLASQLVLAAVLCAGISVLAIAMRKRCPGLLAAWSAHVVTLLPVLGLLHNGPQIAADRYTYLPSLGWTLLAGGALLSSIPSGRPTLARGHGLFRVAVPAIVLPVLALLTWQQVHVWRDSHRLWTHALATHPSSAAHYNVGLGLARQGFSSEAEEHFREALRINPQNSLALNNLAVLLLERGLVADSIVHLRRAIQSNPRNAEAHNNLGSALFRQGDRQEAIEHYRAALRLYPRYVEAHNNLGVALVDQGSVAEAVQEFREALRLRPGFQEAASNLDRALANLGEADRAGVSRGRQP